MSTRGLILTLFMVSCSSQPRPVSTNLSPSEGTAPAGENGLRTTARNAPLPPAHPHEFIAFARGGAIWTMRPNGRSLAQVTVPEAGETHPRVAIHRDGSLLVYESQRSQNTQLYLLDTTEMLPVQLAEGREPAMHPDGRHIVFVRESPAGQRDLMTMALPRGDDQPEEPSLLLAGDDDHPELVGSPTFSTNGAFLVFTADRRRGKGTGLWRLEGGELTPVSPIPDQPEWMQDLAPALHPTGASLVFLSNRHASRETADNFDVYQMRIDGSGLQRLTDDPGVSDAPIYSIDGKRVYFASTRIRQGEYEWELYAMGANGGTESRLTRDATPVNSSPAVFESHKPPFEGSE